MNETSFNEIAIFFAVISGLYSLTTSWFQRKLDRRQRSSSLYENFYSSDNYRRVVLPVYLLTLKLVAYPEKVREKYWHAMIMGWLDCSHAQTALDIYQLPDQPIEAIRHTHFHKEQDVGGFSEHEALTGFLYFWTRTDKMIDTRLIGEDLFCELFEASFAYYRTFLLTMANKAKDWLDDMKSLPDWVEATEAMDRRFKEFEERKSWPGWKRQLRNAFKS